MAGFFLLIFVAMIIVFVILIVTAKPWEPLSVTIDRTVKETIRDRMPDIIDKAIEQQIDELWRTNPRFRFLKWMQQELHRADASLEHGVTWETVKRVLRDWLRDEKIAFGDKRYDWTREGAKELIREYEISHWEPKP